MNFSVDPAALAGLPALLDRMEENVRACRAYLDAETDINWTGEGIINILPGGHRNVQDQIRSFLDTADIGVAGLAGSTGVGLPLALIIGAFTLTRIYKVVNGIFTIIDTIARLDALAYATSSAQNSFGQIDSDTPLPKLPDSLPLLPN